MCEYWCAFEFKRIQNEWRKTEIIERQMRTLRFSRKKRNEINSTELKIAFSLSYYTLTLFCHILKSMTDDRTNDFEHLFHFFVFLHLFSLCKCACVAFIIITSGCEIKLLTHTHTQKKRWKRRKRNGKSFNMNILTACWISFNERPNIQMPMPANWWISTTIQIKSNEIKGKKKRQNETMQADSIFERTEKESSTSLLYSNSLRADQYSPLR